MNRDAGWTGLGDDIEVVIKRCAAGLLGLPSDHP